MVAPKLPWGQPNAAPTGEVEATKGRTDASLGAVHGGFLISKLLLYHHFP